MPDEKEVRAIKDGVEGSIGDVPAPSQEEMSADDDYGHLQETNYSDGSENFQPEQAQVADQSSNDFGTFSQGFAPSGGMDSDRLHEIVEAIIHEKWNDLMGNIGDLAVWKERTRNDLVSTKQELIRLTERFENLQNAILGRVKEYDQGITGIHTEMRALEKVFEKILEPLTSNIKELTRLTDEMKKAKK
jgi:hypothetical protein